jgi:hypothetical protein
MDQALQGLAENVQTARVSKLKPPRRKSNAPLLMGTAILLVALGAGGIILWNAMQTHPIGRVVVEDGGNPQPIVTVTPAPPVTPIAVEPTAPATPAATPSPAPPQAKQPPADAPPKVSFFGVDATPGIK